MEERPNNRQRLPSKNKLSYPLVVSSSGCPSGKRTIRSKSEHLAVEEGKLVECTNTISIDEFRTTYCTDSLSKGFKSESGKFEVSFITAESQPSIIDQCFGLVESTSKDDYAHSETNWSAARKLKEMQLPDLKYLILQTRQSAPQVAGFISFMVTYEDRHEVLYVYEIHLQPEYQGRGLGGKMMAFAEQIARNVGLEKVMLTVFRSNGRAVGMYERLGYAVDEYSPQPKKLRNGTVKESSYLILSKSLKVVEVKVMNGARKYVGKEEMKEKDN